MIYLKWIGRLLFGLAGIAACWGAWYIVYQDSLERMATEDAAPMKVPISVEVVPVLEQEMREQITLVGSLVPIAQTEVRSRTTGYIASMPDRIRIGAVVQKGDELCQLDAESLKKNVQRSKAALQVAQKQLDAREVERDHAHLILNRQRLLQERGASTLEELESAEVALKIAEANVKLEAARVSQAEAELHQAELELEDLNLRAPIDGFIAERMMDVGDLAQPNMPLLRIVKLETVQTTVQVVERDYSKIHVGQRAEVTVDAYPGKVFSGSVAQVSPALDVETRTAPILIDVPNKNGQLKPGMFARVSLTLEEDRKALTIPVAAVIEEDGQSCVMAVDPQSQQVFLRKIERGMTHQGVVEVRSGLDPSEHVITLGNRLVRPGQVVNAVEVPWPVPLVAGQAVVSPENSPGE
ncbi:MAG: efflux RND transporter periplasmic adaptor subunit [Planctomycetaceae bacterium]|nr:efflux RND transporter periplasmic adaptor subunit [Planctomycetaceae bacterium]